MRTGTMGITAGYYILSDDLDHKELANDLIYRTLLRVECITGTKSM